MTSARVTVAPLEPEMHQDSEVGRYWTPAIDAGPDRLIDTLVLLTLTPASANRWKSRVSPVVREGRTLELPR